MIQLKNTAYIAIGSNLAQGRLGPADTVRQAFNEIAAISDGTLTSGLWSSPAWPDPAAQPSYVNAVCRIIFDGTPEMLMQRLFELESRFGRVRTGRNAARTLDLDLIDHGGRVVSGLIESDLSLPHPRAHQRGFVLFPLFQVAPDWVHPASKLTISQLIARLPLKDVEDIQYIGK